MRLHPDQEDQRRTVVTFDSVPEAKSFNPKKTFLTYLALACGLLVENKTGQLETSFKNKQLLKVAHNLGQYSLKESKSPYSDVRLRAAQAQFLANSINGYFAGQLPNMPILAEELDIAPDGFDESTAPATQ